MHRLTILEKRYSPTKSRRRDLPIHHEKRYAWALRGMKVLPSLDPREHACTLRESGESSTNAYPSV